MYSVVLATMLATSSAAPDAGFGGFGFSAFHGCCSGCCGYSNCCGGCCGYGYPGYTYYGSSGCCGYSNYYGGCYGCCGCSGCFGSPIWYVPGTYGYGYSCYGSSCFGGSCCGSVSAYAYGMSYAPAYVAPTVYGVPAYSPGYAVLPSSAVTIQSSVPSSTQVHSSSRRRSM